MTIINSNASRFMLHDKSFQQACHLVIHIPIGWWIGPVQAFQALDNLAATIAQKHKDSKLSS